MAIDIDEVQRTVKHLIEKHGSGAAKKANESLGDMIAQKDAEGIAYWRAVAAAISQP